MKRGSCSSRPWLFSFRSDFTNSCIAQELDSTGMWKRWAFPDLNGPTVNGSDFFRSSCFPTSLSEKNGDSLESFGKGKIPWKWYSSSLLAVSNCLSIIVLIDSHGGNGERADCCSDQSGRRLLQTTERQPYQSREWLVETELHATPSLILSLFSCNLDSFMHPYPRGGKWDQYVKNVSGYKGIIFHTSGSGLSDRSLRI